MVRYSGRHCDGNIKSMHFSLSYHQLALILWRRICGTQECLPMLHTHIALHLNVTFQTIPALQNKLA